VKAYNQKGMSMLSMLVVVILVASGLMLSIQIVPMYINDLAIKKALESLQDEDNLYRIPKPRIRIMLARKLSADYARDFKNDEIIITKNKDTVVIEIVYESRVSAVANLDIVAKFNHRLEKQK